jgi:hypothetical protein
MPEKEQAKNIELEKKVSPLLQVSRDITSYRLETATNSSHKYRGQQSQLLLYLEDQLNCEEPHCLTKGIHYESLFFTALANRYEPNNYFNNPKIAISTGQEDQRGIDFIVFTKSNKFPIDVTVDPGGYPKKMQNRNSLSLLLPEIDPDTRKRYLSYFEKHLLDTDLEDFLQKVFFLNVAILNNCHPNYTIFVKNGKKNKVEKPSSKRPFDEELFGFSNYGEKHRITISKSVYQDTMNLLSIIKNPNL